MVSQRLRTGLYLAALALGCDHGAPKPDAASARADPSPRSEATEVEPTEVEPTEAPAPSEAQLSEAQPTTPGEPPTAPIPPIPAFDPATATAATVRVVAIHREHWSACGVIHSTGAIEVEVLEVGEPPPPMILIVSCPVDFGHRELLEVGATLRVTLFARRQRWPTPPASRKLPAELPRRYVKTLADATAVEGQEPS